MNGARFNPVLRPMYQRMIEAGKPPKVALVALARKPLTIPNAMVPDGTMWDEATAQRQSGSRLLVRRQAFGYQTPGNRRQRTRA